MRMLYTYITRSNNNNNNNIQFKQNSTPTPTPVTRQLPRQAIMPRGGSMAAVIHAPKKGCSACGS